MSNRIFFLPRRIFLPNLIFQSISSGIYVRLNHSAILKIGIC